MMAISCLKQVLIMSSGLGVLGGFALLYLTLFDPSYSIIYSHLSDAIISNIPWNADNTTDLPNYEAVSNDSNLLIQFYEDEPINNSNTSIPLHIIREMRIKPPPKCPNSTHHLFPITPSDHNWAPYYFRCKDLYHQHSPPKRPWIDEGLISKELFFVHVFKAGGTTIRINMDELIADGIVSNLTFLGSTFVIYGGDLDRYSKNEDDKYSQHSILDEFIDENKTITFSFVRDPIDRFLSAFYEAHYRQLNSDENYGISGGNHYVGKSKVEIMRIWIDEIFIRMDDERKVLAQRSRNDDDGGGRRRRRLWKRYNWIPIKDGPEPFINSHLYPNMRFLQGQHRRSSIPFNFIGDLKYLQEDLPQILQPFIVDEEMKRNHTKFMEQFQRKKERKNDNWDYKLRKYLIDRSELSDEDISRICDMYWLDYLCLPFEIPEQCDVDKLIQQHYGVDIEYNHCY